MEKPEKIIHWLGHAAFRLESSAGTVIYVDPYALKAGARAAQAVFITHGHFDHFSPGDLLKICVPATVIYGPASLEGKVKGAFTALRPGDKLVFKDIAVEAVPAYNIGKEFHPKSAGNAGYVFTIDGVRVYHAGDTDLIPEMSGLKAEVALLPVGGTYTMDVNEALEAVKAVKPAVAVPMHYGSVTGSSGDGKRFAGLAACAVFLPEEE